MHAAGSVSISLKFAQREIIQCSHRSKYNSYSLYESITWSLYTQYIYTIFVSYTLIRLGKRKRVGRGVLYSSEWCSVQVSHFIDDAFCIHMCQSPAPTARESAWRDERCWWRMIQPLTQGMGLHVYFKLQFSSVQSLSRVRLFATPWIAARPASLSLTNSRSSLRLAYIESVRPSSHLILCCPLLLLPPIPPSISLFQWVNSSHEVAKVLQFQL